MLVCGVLQELLEAEGRHNKVMAAKAAEIAALRSEEARGTFSLCTDMRRLLSSRDRPSYHKLITKAAVHLSLQVK